MIEVRDLNDLIDKFPMYSNVSLPKDIATKVDDAFVSLLVYRDIDRDTSAMPYDEEVFFIEDSASVGHYLSNIFYESGKEAMVCSSIDEAIQEEIAPKIFFIDLSAIWNHKNLLNLIDYFPDAKIVLMSGIAKYIHCFVKEMQELRPNIELDYVLSRNSDVILNKIKEIADKQEDKKNGEITRD